MTRLSRDAFDQRFASKAIELRDVQHNPAIEARVQGAVRRADLNGDGKVAGHREIDRLFTNLDAFDRDGSFHSIDIGNTAVPTQLGRTIAALGIAARPDTSASIGTPLERLLARHPNLQTHQDLINYFLGAAGGDWNRGQRIARSFDTDLNELVRDRSARIDTATTVPAPTTAATQTYTLEELVWQNPSLRTNQDLINHFMRASGRNWAKAQKIAARYGANLDQLVENRQGAILPGTTTPGPGTTTPGPGTTTPGPGTTTPGPGTTTPSTEPRVVPEGPLRQVFLDNEIDARRMELRPTRNHASQVARFKRVWEQNRARYETVARATGIPAQLIAALHYRESSMNFGTYLHQGDPLGRPAVRHPRNIPVFQRWEDAAIHALRQKSSIRNAVGMTANTTSPAAMATFAERYNGLGYHNRGLPSAYVWAGTNIYRGGRFVADHQFDPSSWDRRPGVMALIGSIQVQAPTTISAVANQTPEQAWQQVLAGNEVLRDGVASVAVTYLQGVLASLGYPIDATGVYDQRTEDAIRAFQLAHELENDGKVGEVTARAITEAFARL